MYRGGLSRGQIAQPAGAALKTVAYHLRFARAAAPDPDLQASHEKAAAQKTTHAATARGLERMRQLVEMVQEKGRYPSRTAESTAERSVAAWMQRRREDARAGALAPAYRDGLAGLPDWLTPPRTETDEARWQERLKALVAYREAGNDWPRHKAVITGEKHELGVWLHLQRSKTAPRRAGSSQGAGVGSGRARLAGGQTGRPKA